MSGENRSEELRILREIARWTRELALPLVRERVERLLDTDSKRRVYQAMEPGTASVTAIEASSGANHNDVRAWLNVWEAEGLAEPDRSPPKATFTLRELGIAPPPPKTTRKATSR